MSLWEFLVVHHWWTLVLPTNMAELYTLWFPMPVLVSLLCRITKKTVYIFVFSPLTL